MRGIAALKNDKTLFISFLVSILVGMVILGIFANTYFQTGYTTQSFSSASDPVWANPPIQDGEKIQQYFSPATSKISEVQVMIGTWMRENHFQLTMEISDLESGDVLVSCPVDASQLVDNAYEAISFQPISVDPDKVYAATFFADGVYEGNSISFYRTDDNTADDTICAALNGEKQSYNLAMTVYGPDNRLDSFVGVILCFLGAFSFAAIYFILTSRPREEKLFAVLALGMGMFYLITITPLSVPDEIHHYQTSYQLSNALLFRWDSLEYGDSADFDYSGFANHLNTIEGYQSVLDGIGEPAAAGEEMLIPPGRNLSYFVEYLPSALGIALARATNQNFIVAFLLGRLCNLLFYVVCLYYAIKNMPKFKIVLGLIGISPMALHQAASFSYDCFINGMSFVLIACIFGAIWGNSKISPVDMGKIALAGILLAPAKAPAYCPIFLLLFLIPKSRFEKTGQKGRWITAIIVSSALVVAVFQLPSLISLAEADPEQVGWQGIPYYSTQFVLDHPLQTIAIFARSLWSMGQLWLEMAVGSILSGGSLPLPKWITIGFIVLILLSAVSPADGPTLCTTQIRCVLLLAAGATILLVMLALFLGWTGNTSLVIQGVQGRYFIPVLPLLAISTNNRTLVLQKNIDKGLAVSAVLLQEMTIVAILWYTLIG